LPNVSDPAGADASAGTGTGPPAVHTDEPDTEELPLLRGERAVARVLTRLVVASALTTILGAAACAMLAPLGAWVPWLAIPALSLLALVATRVSALVTSKPMPVWTAAALIAVALAATVWGGLTSSQQVLPRRDSGSYLQSASSLATTHRTPIEVPAASIGGPQTLRIPGVTLESPAFFQTGTPAAPRIQPQFLIGPAAWYSLAYWLGGVTGATWAAALFGGLGVLALGLLTGAAVGTRWGPLGALGVAICFPILHTNRSTYSEPLAVLVLTAGLLVLAQATRTAAKSRRLQARRLGALSGVLVGGGALIRPDALRETILLLPVAVLMLLRGNRAGRSLLGAAGAATVAAAVAGVGLSSRYLGAIGSSLLPLAALGVLMAVASWLVLATGRRGRRLPPRLRARLPVLAGGAVAVAVLVLASRPLWQTVRQSAADPGSRVVAGLQARQGWPVDGGRTYAEQSVAWTAWWTGPIAVGVTLVALSVAAYRLAGRWSAPRRLPRWAGPYLVALGSALLTWYRPGITPDHPWADRRLVVVLPVVVIGSVAVAAALTRFATRRFSVPTLVAAGVGAAALLLVPEAQATWPHRAERVEAGELHAVQEVCRSFAPGDVALMIDDRAVNEWPQVVRGMCRVPSLALTSAVRRDPARRAAAVAAVARNVRSHGGRLILFAADAPFSPASVRSGVPVRPGGTVASRQVVSRTVLEDARLLERRPDGLVPLAIRVWTAPVLP